MPRTPPGVSGLGRTGLACVQGRTKTVNGSAEEEGGVLSKGHPPPCALWRRSFTIALYPLRRDVSGSNDCVYD